MPKSIVSRRVVGAALAVTLAAGASALVPVSAASAGRAAEAAALPGGPHASQLGRMPARRVPVPPVQQHPARRVCAARTSPRVAECMALERTDVKAHKGLFPADAAPSGYGPADFQSAYNLPSASAGSGVTVAIVDAFDDPNAEANLGVYRAQFGLPACTTANGCFKKVNQEGQQGNYPKPDSGWATEESLDVDMVSAVCPHCHILLVEADDNTDTNLALAEDEAVTLGAKYVSNSFDGPEDPSESGLDQHFNHPGVVITVSSGDSGYGVLYPAASPFVTAVGGTSLVRDSSTTRGWAESVWAGAGSGCSAFEPKPAWQTDTGCTDRTVADVSADADPNTGVAIYDTYIADGWLVVGGTSVASPVIASTYALAGLPAAGSYPARYPNDAELAGSGNELNDVTSGTNGTCSPAYLCTGEPGFDGPTGWGTPNGVGAFRSRHIGRLSGTVTDAGTGKPIGGATVSLPGEFASTGADGTYSFTLPTGSYQLTVSDYGYQTQHMTVTVTANQTTTQNFQLAATPHETASGTVTAGSGEPWSVYARVSWSDGAGHGGQTFTNPATGRYALSLLAGASYTLTVTPLHPGYKPARQKVSVGTRGVSKNIGLPVDMVACTAIGYHPVLSGGHVQAFDASSVPRGWRVTNTDRHIAGYSDRPGWVFTNPGKRANSSGGAGNFAIVDSGHDGRSHYQDTTLTSPALSLAADKSPALQFSTDLEPASNSAAKVQVSADGGKTWATVWRRAGFPGEPGPAMVVVPLPKYAGRGQVRARFGYTGQFSRWWEVDNVFLGNRVCVPQAGGLVVGRVSDSSGAAVNSATVASVTHPGQQARTVATPGDTAVNGGLYELFTAATGPQQFTASMTGFTTGTETTTVTAGKVSTLNFTLAKAAASGAAAR